MIYKILFLFIAIIVVANAQDVACPAGLFATGERPDGNSTCEVVCEAINWSIFHQGWCSDQLPADMGPCRFTCIIRLRLWATIFILVVMCGAVAILCFALPIFVATCSACWTAKKVAKRAKQQNGGMEVKSYQGPQAYNPYAYYGYYPRQ